MLQFAFPVDVTWFDAYEASLVHTHKQAFCASAQDHRFAINIARVIGVADDHRFHRLLPHVSRSVRRTSCNFPGCLTNIVNAKFVVVHCELLSAKVACPESVKLAWVTLSTANHVFPGHYLQVVWQWKSVTWTVEQTTGFGLRHRCKGQVFFLENPEWLMPITANFHLIA